MQEMPNIKDNYYRHKYSDGRFAYRQAKTGI